MVEKKREEKQHGGRKRGCWKFLKKEREDLGFLKNWFFFSFSFSFQKKFHMSLFNWS